MPHIHELYDYTVGVFIVHDNKVLLVQHPRYKMWLSPGGHIELNEDPEEALYRKIAEETGLDVEILSTRPTPQSDGVKSILQPSYIDVHEANPPHKHINFVYFAVSKFPKAKLSDEHTQIKWFSQPELHENIYKLSPALIFYAEKAQEAAKS